MNWNKSGNDMTDAFEYFIHSKMDKVNTLKFDYKGVIVHYPKPPVKTNQFGRQVFFDPQTGEQLKNRPKKELDQCFDVTDV